MKPKKICVLFVDAGGGHRATAIALQKIFENDKQYEIGIYNLIDECLLPMDPVYKLFGIKTEEIYNRWIVKSHYALIHQYIGYFLLKLNIFIRRHQQKSRQHLLNFWERTQPDLVISVAPFFNTDFIQSLQEYNPKIPYLTIMTDMIEAFKGLWYEPGPQYFCCGCADLYQKILSQGHAPNKLFLLSGMLLRPAIYFYSHQMRNSNELRKKLGLLPNLPTALISYGGMGSPAMYKIALELLKISSPFQIIFICGKNLKIYKKIIKLKTSYAKSVQGFTSNIHEYLMAADFFIGKPGPGSVHEALTLKKPLLLHYNRMTMIQEKSNAIWVEKQGYGKAFCKIKKFNEKFIQFLDSNQLENLKQNVSQYHNEANIEVMKIINQIELNSQ